jgi:integrase
VHRLETEAARGKLGGTSATVTVLLNRYLKHLQRKSLSPRTVHTYRKCIDTTIRPAVGLRPVQRLTAWDLDALYATMAEAGKAPSTIHFTSRHPVGRAWTGGRVGVVPGLCGLHGQSADLHQRRIVPPSPEEVRAIVEVAEQRNPTLAALIMLAALTGARRGELCALKWRDVDLDTGPVRIARSIHD